jgi:hypothetical protein
MNDDDLMTTVREEFAPIHMDVAAATIMARGRATRRLRRSQIAAGVLAVGLGAGLGVPALTSEKAGGNAAAGATTLAAWTVTRQANGSVTITIREMRDLPALDAKLAAAGAQVSFGHGSWTPPAGCLAPQADQSATNSALAFHDLPQSYYLVAQPTKIPAGDMVRVSVAEGNGPGIAGSAGSPTLPGLYIYMVHDVPRCGF